MHLNMSTYLSYNILYFPFYIPQVSAVRDAANKVIENLLTVDKGVVDTILRAIQTKSDPYFPYPDLPGGCIIPSYHGMNNNNTDKDNIEYKSELWNAITTHPTLVNACFRAAESLGFLPSSVKNTPSPTIYPQKDGKPPYCGVYKIPFEEKYALAFQKYPPPSLS